MAKHSQGQRVRIKGRGRGLREFFEHDTAIAFQAEGFSDDGQPPIEVHRRFVSATIHSVNRNKSPVRINSEGDGAVVAQKDPLEGGWYCLHRGTPGWGLNRLRSQAFLVLVQILHDAEYKRLSGDATQSLGTAMRRLRDLCSLRPESRLTGALLERIGHYATTVIQWTELQGEGEGVRAERRRAVDDLKHARRRLARLVREWQGCLAAEVGWPRLDELFSPIEEFAHAYADEVPRLHQCVITLRRIQQRAQHHPKERHAQLNVERG